MDTEFFVKDPLESMERFESMEDENYYYDELTNITGKKMEFCDIGKPSDEVAGVMTSVFSVVGILLNFIVVFVMTTLKEYKLSGIHWSALMIFVSNGIFLIWMLLHLINEYHGHWIMGLALCKLYDASLHTTKSAATYFLALANFLGIFSVTGWKHRWASNFSLKTRKLFRAFKYPVATLIIFIPCTLVNLPIYKYKIINECNRCVLDLPIHVHEFCPMLGLNTSSCKDLMGIVAEEFENETKFALYYGEDDELYPYSGFSDIDSNEFNKILESDIQEMVELTACWYEEPLAFYIWIAVSFVAFFAIPVIVLIVYVICWSVNMSKANHKTTSNNSKAPLLGFVLALDILFVISWTPWYVIHMKKAFGGLGGSGRQCVSMIQYSKLVAVLFNSLSPIVYEYKTGGFRSRISKSINSSANFCYDLLQFNEKERNQEKSKLGEVKSKQGDKDKMRIIESMDGNSDFDTRNSLGTLV